ncbi:hypothetical protein CEXT_41981 [Caerostris extrusa]|nr:hypothetical protein CEXT_41981 [Caerostris extrusa]
MAILEELICPGVGNDRNEASRDTDHPSGWGRVPHKPPRQLRLALPAVIKFPWYLPSKCLIDGWMLFPGIA